MLEVSLSGEESFELDKDPLLGEEGSELNSEKDSESDRNSLSGKAGPESGMLTCLASIKCYSEARTQPKPSFSRTGHVSPRRTPSRINVLRRFDTKPESRRWWHSTGITWLKSVTLEQTGRNRFHTGDTDRSYHIEKLSPQQCSARGSARNKGLLVGEHAG